MAEETKKKKPKIDLKARLGKTMAAGGGGAAPAPGSTPPPADGSVPAPPAAVAKDRPSGIAPPPGLSPGIPLPPFGAPKPAPRKAAEPKQTAQAQTIKVEVGEEVEEARKKSRGRIAVAAVLAAIVGGVLGFTAGGARERGERANVMLNGAKDLSAEVKAANDVAQELSVALDDAITAISQKQYPADLPDKLNAINIPFDATKLQKRGIDAMPGKAAPMLLEFTMAVAEVNKSKETLGNLVGYAKDPVEKAWKEEKEPVFSLSVTFRGSNEKMVAELVPNKEPFKVGEEKWPEELTIIRREFVEGKQKAVDKKAKRWQKGDLTGNPPLIIPVDPKSVAGFTSEELVLKLRSALLDTKEALEGVDHPTDPKPGLIKLGKELSDQLYDVSLAAP